MVDSLAAKLTDFLEIWFFGQNIGKGVVFNLFKKKY